MASPCQRFRERFRHARGCRAQLGVTANEKPKMRPIATVAGHDRRFEEIDAEIKAEKARRSRPAPLRKLAQVVRTVVGRFRKTNPNWRQQFEIHLGAFRLTHRDRDWYGEQIARWETWLADFERRTEPFEWWEAMPLAHLAQVTHEHREFKRAAGYYRKAICAAHRAVLTTSFLSPYACGAGEFRINLIRYFETQIEACQKGLSLEAFIFPRKRSGG